MAKYKVIKTPHSEQMKDGGNTTPYASQTSRPYFSLNLGQRVFDPTDSVPHPFNTRETLEPVDRDEASYEAEAGESIIRQNSDGSNSFFNVGGKKHYDGGTPIRGGNDFVFSDTKKMEIGGDILNMFGKSEGTKQKFTPAELSKKYPINEYQAIVNNPDSDKLAKDTAQMMIQNNLKKLQAISLIQESKKGFPTGIPQISVGDKGAIQAKFGGLMQVQEGFDFTGVARGAVSGAIGASNSVYDPLLYTPPVYPDAQPSPWELNGVMPTLKPEVNQPGLPKSFVQDQSQPTSSESSDTSIQAGVATPYTNNIPYGISQSDRTRILGRQLASAFTQPYKVNLHAPTYTATAPILSSPERAIAALQESANAQTHFGEYYSGEARNRANASANQNSDRIADTLGRYENQRNTELNDYAKRFDEARNKTSEAQALIANEQQSTNNSLQSKYRTTLTENTNAEFKNFAQARDNANRVSQINAINNRSPFYIDPYSGRMVRNQNWNEDLDPTSSGSKGEQDFMKSRIAYYTSLGAAPDKALEYAHRDATYERTRTSTSPFNLKANRTYQSDAPILDENTYQQFGGFVAGPYR